MADGVVAGRKAVLARQRVDVRRRGAADDLAVVLVFLDDHEYVIERRHATSARER